MNQEQLNLKIKALFEYREFTFLFELAGASSQQKNKILNKLVDLQTQIYYLDNHLEKNWQVDHQELERCWNEIFNSLMAFDVPLESCDRLTAHIRKYQKHELELRERLLPTRFNMTFFYFYKSCDVKLLRVLLYKSFPILNRYANAGDWRFFDFVTEVNDDVEDVFEDVSTINGNRFLLSLYQKGIKKTKHTFHSFLDESLQKSLDRFDRKANILTTLIHTKTEENISLTKQLIEENANVVSKHSQKEIQVFKHLNLDQKRAI